MGGVAKRLRNMQTTELKEETIEELTASSAVKRDKDGGMTCKQVER